MSFTELLSRKSAETKSIVCMGIDPVIEKIPVSEKNKEKKIVKFYSDIIAAAAAERAMPASVKPNYAFFAQYGFAGLRALKKIIKMCRSNKLLVILDAKRGDIGSSSEAYAKEVFDFWKADAVTVSPYMGFDSIVPFLQYCKKGKGVYMLVRTSNKGAADLQDIDAGGKRVYMKAAEKLVEWHTDGLGAVVGATSIAELGELHAFFAGSGRQIPLLIPGVGAQGGSARKAASVLRKSSGDTIGISDITIHRINSSSGISYACEKYKTEDYASAAVRAIKELNAEIGLIV